MIGAVRIRSRPRWLRTRSAVRACAGAVALILACGSSANAQDEAPDTRPLTVNGDVIVTAGSDDPGFFNYTDYERSALRLTRIGLVSTWRPNGRLLFLGELRAEGDLTAGHWSVLPYAAYAQVRPWIERPIVIRAGRIPTAFGGFTRESYGAGNLLIGYPLAYQYLTPLRADAVPASADDLLAMRGRGWYSGFPVGNLEWEHGSPIAAVFRYDTGASIVAGDMTDRATGSVSVTTGTLSNPRVSDDNGSLQVAGRATLRPVVGLVLGASASRGAFVADSVRRTLAGEAARRQYVQRAVGADVEYSRDYWLVRSEFIASDWQLPAVQAPLIEDPVGATSWLIEGRYAFAPGFAVAARYDRLWFSSIAGSGVQETWDADVSRIETGVSYKFARHVTAKISFQHNSRDGGRVRHANLAAAQVRVWF